MTNLVISILAAIMFSYFSNAGISWAANNDNIIAYELEKFTNPYSSDTQKFVKSRFEVIGFSGQTAYISFTLYNKGPDDLNKLILTVNKRDDFENQGGNVDFFLVHPWNQATTFNAPKNEKPISLSLVPELLLKNNTIPLVSGTEGPQVASASLMSDDLHTSISSGSFRYFCLKILLPRVDRNAEFSLNLQVVKEKKIIFDLPIQASVLQHSLPRSDKIKALYFFGGLDEQEPGYYPPERLVKQLSDIRSHGFQGITLKGHEPARLRQLAELARKEGVGNYAILIFTGGNDDELLKKCYAAVQEILPNVYVMSYNEPNSETELVRHRNKRKRWKKLGISVYAPIRLEWDKKIWGDAPLDWVNYSYKENLYDELEILHQAPSKIKTYYWQIYMETPVLNRYLSGFFLYNSGLDGILPYVYRHEFENDLPYGEDFRFMVNNSRQQQKTRKYYYVTYPSALGPIPTLQWEAFIEGENDLRYCYLIEELILALKQGGQENLAHEIKRDFNNKLLQVCRFYPADRLKAYQKYEMELSRSIEELRAWILNVWQKYSKTN